MEPTSNIQPAYITSPTPADNLDSMAVFGKVVYVTAKGGKRKKGAVKRYSISGGKYLGNIGGKMKRPNGIAIVNNDMFIVDRDNHVVYVYWINDNEGEQHMGSFGRENLIRPYGIAVHSESKETFNVYITDSSDNTNRHRVVVFRVRFIYASVEWVVVAEKLGEFGDRTGPGIIHVAESIITAPDGDRIFVADEHAGQRNIKIYSDSERSAALIIVAPHTCIVPQRDDPGCDFATGEISEAIHRSFPGSLLLKNEVLRKAVDQNRASGAKYDMRLKLRETMRTGDYVIEVHSFHDDGSFPGIDGNTEIVILTTHLINRATKFESELANVMSNSKIVYGSTTVNDISVECEQRGCVHALIEFRDTLTSEQFETHIREMQTLLGNKFRQQNAIPPLIGKRAFSFNGDILTGFRTEPEGIALYNLDENNWYVICTDQSNNPEMNEFRIYNGRTLKYITKFKINGISVTDGICISQQPVAYFNEGVMIASDRDQSIAVADLSFLRKVISDSREM